MRADHLERHRMICTTYQLNAGEHLSSCTTCQLNTGEQQSNLSSSSAGTPSRPSNPKQVFQQVQQYKHLDFEDKLVAPRSMKKMSSTLRNITSAKEERRLVYERTKCLDNPTAGQKRIIWLLEKHINADLNKQSPILILEDKQGQSGKSTLAKSLMHCSESSKEVKGLRLPQQYNFFFVYMRNLNVEQCSSFISYEELLPSDEKRRFILWLDITREFRIPSGKLESIHDGLLDVGSLAKESLHLLQPFFVIVTCNESRQLVRMLSLGRYNLQNISDNDLKYYMERDIDGLAEETTNIEKAPDQLQTSDQKIDCIPTIPAVQYTVKRKIQKNDFRVTQVHHKLKTEEEREDMEHTINVLTDKVENSEAPDLVKETWTRQIDRLKSSLKLDAEVKEFRKITK